MLTNNTNVQASVESVSQYNFESEGEMLNYKQYDTGVQEDTSCKETEPNSRKSSTSDVEVIQNTESVYEHLARECALKEQCLPLTVQTTKHSSLLNRENIENESGKLCSLQNQSTISDTSHGKCLMEDRELSQGSDTSSTSDIFEHYDTMMRNFFLGEKSLNNQLQSPTPPISEQSATSIKSVEEEESTTRRRSRPTQADTKQKRPVTFATKLVAEEKEPGEKKDQDDPEEDDRIRFLPHRQLLLRHRNDQQRVGMGQIKKAERISKRCLNKADEDGAKRALQAEERRRLRLGRKLLGAARAGDADRLLAMWHAGAYADAPDRRGETPLHAAATGGHEMVLRALLAVAPGDAHSGGADVRARDAQGRTALHRAAARGQTRCVELLLEADGGPDLVDVQDARGRTALHEAAARGHVTAAIRLLDGGASPALRDALGRTARDEVSAATKRAKGSKNVARLSILDMTMRYKTEVP
ncbi:hypothetical protein R5R35_013280 [Gryllus longicercus]|uniref:Uncharacterized protein n=1 Tax=Gryllus longicercus TaxID=2509291 RepID=A0AAN9ZFT2_9ORTH